MPDFDSMFVPDIAVLETILRGTLTYLGVLVLMRVIVRQATGSLNIADLLLIVLVADAAQNAMSADYNSITNGLVLVATLMFWSVVLDWFGYNVPALGKWLHPTPVAIVENGRELQRNMRRELISHDELMTRIRLAGGEKIEDVKRAWVEGSGEISVVLNEGETKHEPTAGERAV